MRAADVWKVSAMRPYVVARSVSALGSAMAVLAVVFAILEMGGSASLLGLVFAAGTVRCSCSPSMAESLGTDGSAVASY